MGRDALTGSRIRERRSMAGLRQTELAKMVGVSASYLNLIEHNRRRIGGKLLIDIARALEVEPTMLTQGAEAALVSALREAADNMGVRDPETGRADALAGRFPVWAQVLLKQHRRIAELERLVETLADRLTHDPHLADSLHELLSTATAIRSTASILAEPGEIAPEWQGRFHRNLNEDSLRLAQSSKALAHYLETISGSGATTAAPLEEAEAFLSANAFHFAELERSQPDIDKLLAQNADWTGDAARQIAHRVLSIFAADARALPQARVRAALDAVGEVEPLALAQHLRCDLPRMLRRLATLPAELLPGPAGLVVCDAAGSILLRRPIEGFAVPRFGASCPLWPLFGALMRPHIPLRTRLVQLGRGGMGFDAIAIAQPVGRIDYDRDPLYQSTMLLLPAAGPVAPGRDALSVGSTCRVCPATACIGRREPSILGDAF